MLPLLPFALGVHPCSVCTRGGKFAILNKAGVLNLGVRDTTQGALNLDRKQIYIFILVTKSNVSFSRECRPQSTVLLAGRRHRYLELPFTLVAAVVVVRPVAGSL